MRNTLFTKVFCGNGTYLADGNVPGQVVGNVVIRSGIAAVKAEGTADGGGEGRGHGVGSGLTRSEFDVGRLDDVSGRIRSGGDKDVRAVRTGGGIDAARERDGEILLPESAQNH